MPRKITTGVVGGPVLGNISSKTNTFETVENNTNIIFTPAGTGVAQFTKDILTSTESGVRFGDGDTNYALIKAPNALSSNYTLTLPINDGGNGDALVSDGSGNLSFTAPKISVADQTTDSATYYPTITTTTSGTATGVNVSSSKLLYQPSTGRLSSNQLRATASTASSSTSTGALVVTGGAGVGGQMTAQSIVETSSIALKENIEPISNGLDSILKLKGVTYDRLDNNEHESGLIAEWTENILPELVTRDTNGDVVGIKYTKITAYLIEAIKTLKTEIDTLKGL